MLSAAPLPTPFTVIRGGLPAGQPARQRVIIVGAGMAGLVAAYELLRAGHDPLVLEAQQRVGGRILTLREPFTPRAVRRGRRDAHPARARADAGVRREVRTASSTRSRCRIRRRTAICSGASTAGARSTPIRRCLGSAR